MKERKFLRELFQALRAHGAERIDVDEDRHHARLATVVEYINTNPERAKEADLDTLCLIPNPFSGRYPEWDTILLDTLRGYSEYRFYPPSLWIRLSVEHAKETLQELPPARQAFLQELAAVYMGEELPTKDSQNVGENEECASS